MKLTMIFLLFISSSSFAQTAGVKSTATTDSLRNPDRETLLKELQTAIKNAKLGQELITEFKLENETLRQIMIRYVNQIDQLNALNLELQSKLDDCEKK
jgi:hypothetical protein